MSVAMRSIPGLSRNTVESAGSFDTPIVPFGRSLTMTLRTLRWIAIAAPLTFVAMLELGRWLFNVDRITLLQRSALNIIVIAVAILFSAFVLRSIERVQKRLARQNQELLALHTAGVDVTSDLTLEVVLQKVCDRARELVGSAYGALAVMRHDGSIEAFITSGLSEEQRNAIGHPPIGRGLLGVALHQGQSLRVTDIAADPRSVGFPDNHPPMRSLLAVPIRGKSPFAGNLYLAEKHGGREFTKDDQETLARFGIQAAIAIDNAWLHERVHDLAIQAERQRIAHEMHDGLAQVLGYVNTKAQAVDGFLSNGNVGRAREQLQELAGAARGVYADVREMIVGLRSLSTEEGGMPAALREYARTWSGQSGIEIEAEVDTDLHLDAEVELQVLRIAQESLTNVRRHARAEMVDLVWRRDGDFAVLSIQDDGSGFATGTSGTREGVPRFGLTTMRERAQAIRGELAIESTSGAGTKVTLRVPAQATAARA